MNIESRKDRARGGKYKYPAILSILSAKGAKIKIQLAV
jgi:hypothetical protein